MARNATTPYAAYATRPDRQVTPQGEPTPGLEQIEAQNHAGGFTFTVSDWDRLDRFLILGSDTPTYYQNAQKLTAENAAAVLKCAEKDPLRTVLHIVRISESGRAPKNEPALFALALVAGAKNDAARTAALEALPRVARTGTHLFHFAAYAEGQRGWGRGLRRAVARWYGAKSVPALAYQVIKYRQRDGWAHRDLFRLAHPVAPQHAPDRADLYRYIVKGWESVGDEPHPTPGLDLVWAFEKAQRATDAAEIVNLIQEHGLPREAIPTQFLKDTRVWEALLMAGRGMPFTALIRNLGVMSSVGLIAGNTAAATKEIVRRLSDGWALREARVHPLAVLVAMNTYRQGHGVRGGLTWKVNQAVIDALDTAFYAAFGNVVPTGRPYVLALDVSGSMSSPDLAGMPGISPRVGSVAMAMVTARTEPAHEIVAFASGSGGYLGGWGGSYDRQDLSGIRRVGVSPRQRLDDVLKTVDAIPMGGTDCSLPMLWAAKEKVEADTFVVLTDNETWAGAIKPYQALRDYRQKMSRPAKLVVVGMTSTGFTIADQRDAGMLDCVGFDTATPNIISQFTIGFDNAGSVPADTDDD